MVTIEYTTIDKADSFGDAVREVAEERKFLITTTGYSTEQTRSFVTHIIENGFTQFFALDNSQVVGWCDILQCPQELHRHVGVLGMGLIKPYRGQGLGRTLINTAIAHARTRGIERIELEVFASNDTARKLYEKTGFVVEGIKKNAVKIDGRYIDSILMGLV
jgi:RimJ/RimL family protein N-acetyltransferase